MEEEAEKLKQLQTEVDKQMNLGSPTGLSKFLSTLVLLSDRNLNFVFFFL